MSVFLLVVSGCAEAESNDIPFAGSIAIRDTEDAEIVFSRDSLWRGPGRWTLSREPVLVLGPEFPDGRFTHQIGDIERLRDGRLVVENRGFDELLVFDSTGLLLEAWGGRGEGPGEFRAMRGLSVCGDGRLMEVEWARITLLDTGGRVLQTWPFPALPPGVNRNSLARRGVRADCRAILVTVGDGSHEPTGVAPSSHLTPMRKVHSGSGSMNRGPIA